MRAFVWQLGKLGFVWQFITLAGLHSNGYISDLFAKQFATEGMKAYVELIQRREREIGCDVLTHQKWSGADYVDNLMKTVTGGVSSTAAMGKGVTEAQFAQSLSKKGSSSSSVNRLFAVVRNLHCLFNAPRIPPTPSEAIAMDAEERIQAASRFLLQSPPGEINDVLNDVRNIISDDDTLQAGILPALRDYNLAQFITAEVPGHQHQCIVSEAARVPKVAKAPKVVSPKVPDEVPVAAEPSPEGESAGDVEGEGAAEVEGEKPVVEEGAGETDDVVVEAEAEAEAEAEVEVQEDIPVPAEEPAAPAPIPVVEETESSENDVDRFWDPRTRTSFRFDHLTLEASDPEPVEPWEESEPFRVALETSALTYLSAHFHDGVISVFSTQDNLERFTVQLVANKYNPSNFWSGRWRSEYIVDLTNRKLEGRILVNVHYYEQGNVQLATTHTVSMELPPTITSANATGSASKILALIEKEEARYQMSLNEAYQEMSDKTFKGLRRALPLTRAKLDWDRVLGYKLGAELSANKGGFGAA
ncbi:hypothetical protein NM688_g5788 [Phlebia brevispora]|uniref:Uncharacterized protein n=1 Tax=Phlebia brevispora TaxID=194682 RepID=A0ACC1SPX2_9APHY|nr:hypothetical protein NM688_g5788 [Phlebia brevispora]